MLSDEQVDQLEQLIIYSTMDNLPLVLSRAIPLLFAELRTVRAALDQKANSFLEGVLNEQAAEQAVGTSDGEGPSGLHERDVDQRPDEEASFPDKQAGPAVPGGDSATEKPAKPARPRRGRNRPAARRDQPVVDAGASVAEVDGPVRDAAGDPRILPLQSHSRSRG